MASEKPRVRHFFFFSAKNKLKLWTKAHSCIMTYYYETTISYEKLWIFLANKWQHTLGLTYPLHFWLLFDIRGNLVSWSSSLCWGQIHLLHYAFPHALLQHKEHQEVDGRTRGCPVHSFLNTGCRRLSSVLLLSELTRRRWAKRL